MRLHKPKGMVMFMKHHPCHFSSGNARVFPEGYLFNGKCDSRSCAEKIIRYYNTVLKPNGTALTIVVAWLYKAFWQFAVREDDKVTAQNSLEGLKLLLQAGITVRGFRPHDWLVLANLSTESIYLKHLFSDSRMRADMETQKFIDKITLEIHNKEEERVTVLPKRVVGVVEEDEPQTKRIKVS